MPLHRHRRRSVATARSTLGLTRQDIRWLTAEHHGIDRRWWWVAADVAAMAAQQEVERHRSLQEHTVQLTCLAHFCSCLPGTRDSSLAVLEDIAQQGVPPALLHRLILQLAGLGSAAAAGASHASRRLPGRSAAEAHSRMQALLPDYAGSWAHAVSACVGMPELLAAASDEEARGQLARRQSSAALNNICLWEAV